MAATFHIDTLVGENYSTWKIQMRSVLKECDLWGYVDGSITKPEEIDEKYAEWVRMDGKAEAKIILSVCKSNYTVLDGLTSSKAIWEKLRDMHQSTGPARKASLLKKVLLTKLQEDGNLRRHITEFSDAVKELTEIGIDINDEVLAITLMYSLPASFSMFRTAMESRDDLPTTEILKVKIIEEYESRDQRHEDQGAMYSKWKNRRAPKKREDESERCQGQGHSSTGKVQCFRCQKWGHIAKNCPEKGKGKPHARQIQDGENIGEKSRFSMLSTTEEVLYGQDKSSVWCLDSGCTGHMCNEKRRFLEFTKSDSELNLANNQSTRITGIGKVNISVDTGREKREVDLLKVFYVSDLRTNLLSVSAVTSRGYEVKFREKDAIVTDKNNQVIVRADRVGNLYYVRTCQDVTNNVEVESEPKKPIDEWHERLGHVNERDLKLMAKSNLVYGLKFSDNEKLSDCEICAREKQTCKPFPTGKENRTRDLLEIVHTDVCGPMRHASLGGKKYFVTFIDDKSRWCEVYFIKNKSDVLDIFKSYKAEVETYTGKKIKFLQSDNGLEYVNREFDKFLKSNGIRRRLTVPHTPQQNGIAERKKRTLVEMARCMMRQAGSFPAFWAEAINTACYVRNRCPTSALDGGIPFTVWTGKIPTVDFMQVFGAKVFVKDKTPNKGKFDSRAIQGIFVGYDTSSKAYRVHIPESRKTVVSRDVKFMSESAFRHEYREILDENDFGSGDIIVDLRKKETNEEVPQKPKKILRAVRGGARSSTVFKQQSKAESMDRIPQRTSKKRGATLSWEMLVEPSKRGRGRPKLIRTGSRGRPRKQYASCPDQNDDSSEGDSEEEYGDELPGDDEVFANMATNDPVSWREAKESLDTEAWDKAIEKEMVAQIKNGTWEIVSRPANRKVIGSRFVFCTKSTSLGEIKKARLVAKGCSLRPGEDFYETYSPVVRSTSIRLLSALSAEYGLEIHQMDVVTAYLNGELEDVFMEVPEALSDILERISAKSDAYEKIVVETAERWRSETGAKSNCVCLLKKSLYGLRQSGLQWYKKLLGKLKKLNFGPLTQDSCLFMSRKNEKIMLIAVYVDDMLIATNDDAWLRDVKNKLSNEFEMKDLGKVNQCFGIELSRGKNHSVSLSQKAYTEKVLERFGMSECKPAPTPIDVNCKIAKPEVVNEENMGNYPYQNAIGALMLLAVTTRPDIAYAVNYLGQFNNNYGLEHWKALKRVMRYLKGTLECGLLYEGTGLQLFGAVDADWGSCKIDRRSYSGYVFILAGSPVSWEARKQRAVALSSTEAEYMALSEATKEAMYLRDVLTNIGMDCECVTLFNDNQSAIKLTKSDSFHARTKHIDVRHHFIRDVYNRGIVNIKYLCTEKLPADVLTKGLNDTKHRECSCHLGMSYVYE